MSFFEGQLYKRGKDHNLCLYVPEDKYLQALAHAHVGVARGHFSIETTTKTILWPRLWWPTLHHDSQEY